MLFGRFQRNFLATESRPCGVFRILLSGDSMVFGQGVPAGAALPAALQRVLNRSRLQGAFECLNQGSCGYSLHHAWELYQLIGRNYRPDLVVVVVSQNDVELAQGLEREYRAHLQAIWRGGSPELVVFRERVRMIADEARGAGTRLAFAFYEPAPSHWADWIGRAREEVGAAATAAGTPWIDLSRCFDGSECPVDAEAMVVSPADAHPSREAHVRAARRLARELARLGLLDGAGGCRVAAAQEYFWCLRKAGRPMLESAHLALDLAGIDPSEASATFDGGELYWHASRGRALRLFEDAVLAVDRRQPGFSAHVADALQRLVEIRAELFRAPTAPPGSFQGVLKRLQGAEEGRVAELPPSTAEFQQMLDRLSRWGSIAEEFDLVGQAAYSRLRTRVTGLGVVLRGLLDLLLTLDRAEGAGLARTALEPLQRACASLCEWVRSWPGGRALSCDLEGWLERVPVARPVRLLVVAKWIDFPSPLLTVSWQDESSEAPPFSDSRRLVPAADPRVYEFEPPLRFAGRLTIGLLGVGESGNERLPCGVVRAYLMVGDETYVLCENKTISVGSPWETACVWISPSWGRVPERIAQMLFKEVTRLAAANATELVVFGANDVGVDLASRARERGMRARIVDTYLQGREVAGFFVHSPSEIDPDSLVAVASPRCRAAMIATLDSLGHRGPRALPLLEDGQIAS